VPLLIYFIVMTNKYIKDGDATDIYTKLTFVFLSSQLFFQTCGGVLDYLILMEWGADRIPMLLNAMAFTRTGVFFSQNTALFFNIGRWLLVIKSLTGSLTDDYKAKLENRVRISILANVIYTAVILGFVLF